MQLIIGLKALSNTGIITEYFTDSLRGIIKNMDVDISIRLAAVETYRRLPCEPNRNYFEKLFWNFDENAEIRIAAYLQVMRCPNYLVMRTIKSSLQHEEVNQGIYIILESVSDHIPATGISPTGNTLLFIYN